MSKIPCSVEILTRNSAQTLVRCLESVKDFDDIIILDGNSTDSTVEIAARYGARIFKQYETEEPLVQIADFSEVRNKGLRLAKYDWFMYIDSDEYLSEEAVEEIRQIVSNPDPPACVFWQPRKYVLDGKVIACATTYPNQQIRLFHRAYVEGFTKPIHERVEVKPGVAISSLKNYEYVPLGKIEELESRWKLYMEAEERMLQGLSGSKLIQLAIRQLALFIFYALRYCRNLVFCRGNRVPFIYEWTRHKYLLKLAWRMFRV